VSYLAAPLALCVAALIACDSSAGSDAGPVDAPVPAIDAGPVVIECRAPHDCGEPEPGEFSECVADEFCALAGERSREVVMPTCVDNTCGTETVTEVEDCARQTNGLICQDSGEFCGKPADCHVCQGGACVLNAPHFDSNCSPSCGALGNLCETGSECCDLGDFCGQGELPGAYDCQRCCAFFCQ
jgi:hypothetical protein